jgi:hypothetical protein
MTTLFDTSNYPETEPSQIITGMSDQHDIHVLIDGGIMQVLWDMDKAWVALLLEAVDE